MRSGEGKRPSVGQESISGSSESSRSGSMPLQLALGYLLVRAFPIQVSRTDEGIYSATFVASILSLVGREAFELCPRPATFEELLAETDGLIRKETTRIAKAIERLQARGQIVSEEKILAGRSDSWLGHLKSSFEDVSEGAAFIDTVEKDLRDRLSFDAPESLLDAQEVFDKRSPIGLWIRSFIMTLRKLSFEETASLARNVAAWCGIASTSTAPWIGMGSHSRKLAMDDTLARRSNAMREYQSAMRSGDWSGAVKGLRRLYDYQFPSSGRGQHQHALLNLASFHHSTGGLEASRLAINEAVRIARAEGDKACLQLCMSLLHRLDMETSPPDSSITRLRPASISGKLPKSSNAIDELWTLRVALDLGEPLPLAFQRIYTTLARLLPLKPDRENPSWTAESPFPIAAWHAAQAALWNLAASRRLTELHEDLALSSEEANDDVRLTALLSRAIRLTDEAEYDQALTMMLEYPSEGMGMAEYNRWSEVLWSILDRRARMGGDHTAQDLITAMRPPLVSSSRNATTKRGVKVQEELRAKLRKALKMTESHAPSHLVLPEILFCVHTSQKLGLWSLYRLAVVIYADTLLSSESEGMGLKAKAEVEAIWDQIIGGDDIETQCRGALVLGRAYIDIGLQEADPPGEDNEDGSESLDEARTYLLQALELAKRLEAHALIVQSTELLALLSELKGDAAAEEYASQADRTRSGDDSDAKRKDEIRKIGEIVKLVGIRVAEGW